MSPFVAAIWPPPWSASGDIAGRLSRHLAASGWCDAFSAEGLRVWRRADRPLPTQGFGAGSAVLIGDIHTKSTGAQYDPASRPAPGVSGLEAVLSQASAMCERAWGSYVAVWRQADGQGFHVLREPCGSVEALVWENAGVTFVASSFSQPGIKTLLGPVGIDDARLAEWLGDGREVGGRLALTGVIAAAPGVLLSQGGGASRETALWSPGKVARQAAGREGWSPLDLGYELRATIDRCVAAIAPPGSVSIAEISGGLDSAITASALSRSRGAKVSAWLNYYVDDEEGDERAYARTVATRLGIDMTEVRKQIEALNEETLASVSDTPRPSFNSMDLGYDRDVARRARNGGAERVFTGQGGDTVFFAHRTPLIAADARRRLGWRSIFTGEMRDLAVATRSSIWSIWTTALASDATLARLGLTRDASAAVSRHPWLQELEDLPPGKTLQLQDLAFALLFHGECLRSRGSQLVHVPLLQPVLEHCLAIPTDLLAQGGRDRSLVREAFATRLPRAVIERRGKGDLTAAYGRELSADAPFLRDYLLGGALVQRRLVDAASLERRLSDESLLRFADYADLQDLTAIEAWVRHWSSWRSGEPAWR